MKTVIKLVLVKTILFLITTSAAAQIPAGDQINTIVSGSFLGANGLAIDVDVVRTQDPTTKLITTEMGYNTCLKPSPGVACQTGIGIIPNEAFQGIVYSQANRPDTLILAIDTNAVPGFNNSVCIPDQYLLCTTLSPATGGVIRMSWTRTNAWENISTITQHFYQLGKLTSSVDDIGLDFSANAAGNFFDTTVAGPDIDPAGSPPLGMATRTYSEDLKTKFAAAVAAKFLPFKGGH
jgi:hypothetical protein